MKSLPVIIFAGLILQGCVLTGGDALSPGLEDTREPVGGIVGGGLVSRASGGGLSREDRLLALRTEYRALEREAAGQPVSWQDDKTGNGGTVTAEQPYRVGSQDCRAYVHVVEVKNVSKSVRGTACRNEDGSWTLLN